MRSPTTRTVLLAVTCVAALTVAAPTGVSAHPRSGLSYRVEPLGPAAGRSPHAVNDRGVVVGVTRRPDDGFERGFVWHPRTRQTTPIPTLGGLDSQANDVDDSGVVVGGAETVARDMHAVRYDSRTGVLQDLGTLPGHRSSVATGVNDRGVVVGHSTPPRGRETRAFRWDPRTGRMQDLGTLGGDWSRAHDINDRGVIVGGAEVTVGNGHAFRWDPRTQRMSDLGVLPDIPFTTAHGINDRGDVVGTGNSVGDNSEQAFVWSARTRTMRTFLNPDGPPPGSCGCNGPGTTTATAINDRGLVIGSYETRGRAYVWSARTGEVLLLPGLGGHPRTGAVDIDERGTVVGGAVADGGQGALVRWVRHGRRG